MSNTFPLYYITKIANQSPASATNLTDITLCFYSHTIVSVGDFIS